MAIDAIDLFDKMCPTRAAIIAARLTDAAVVSFRGGRVVVTFSSVTDPIVERLIREQDFLIEPSSPQDGNIALFSRDKVDV
jgi:hypothetical protein